MSGNVPVPSRAGVRGEWTAEPLAPFRHGATDLRGPRVRTGSRRANSSPHTDSGLPGATETTGRTRPRSRFVAQDRHGVEAGDIPYDEAVSVVLTKASHQSPTGAACTAETRRIPGWIADSAAAAPAGEHPWAQGTSAARSVRSTA
jgi:hypothetical protein